MPSITFNQVDKSIQGDTRVYSFNILVDGVMVMDEVPAFPEGYVPTEDDVIPTPEPKLFMIQVQNGLCEKEALKGFLDRYEADLLSDPSLLPDLSLPEE